MDHTHQSYFHSREHCEHYSNVMLDVLGYKVKDLDNMMFRDWKTELAILTDSELLKIDNYATCSYEYWPAIIALMHLDCIVEFGNNELQRTQLFWDAHTRLKENHIDVKSWTNAVYPGLIK